MSESVAETLGLPLSITAKDARDILGFYGLPGGWKPGGFRMSLIETIERADPANRRALALGFPGTVAAFEICQHNVAGIQLIASEDES